MNHCSTVTGSTCQCIFTPNANQLNSVANSPTRQHRVQELVDYVMELTAWPWVVPVVGLWLTDGGSEGTRICQSLMTEFGVNLSTTASTTITRVCSRGVDTGPGRPTRSTGQLLRGRRAWLGPPCQPTAAQLPELRVLEGYRRANGAWTGDDCSVNSLYAPSVELRDDLIIASLHGDYSATFALAYLKGRSAVDRKPLEVNREEGKERYKAHV
jgi:hypothetical protein